MELDRLDHIYRDVILDHARSPRHQEEVPDPDIQGDAINPFCGDEIHLRIKLGPHGRALRIGLQSSGCAICQASGSMLTEAIEGKSPGEMESLAARFRALMAGQPLSDGDLDSLGPLRSLAGVREYPIRIKCALLAWTALERGLEAYQRQGAPRP